MIDRLATDVKIKDVNGSSKVSNFIIAVDRNAEEAALAVQPQFLTVLLRATPGDQTCGQGLRLTQPLVR